MGCKRKFNQTSINKLNIIKYKAGYRKGDFPQCDYEELMKVWGLTPTSFKNVRAVLKVETKEGTFACKYFKYDLNLFNFINQGLKHLRSNGLNNIMDILPTLDGKACYQDERGNIFFLMPWIHGRESNLNDTKELYLTSKFLAKFHLTSQGFNPKGLTTIPNSWGKWIDKYKTSLNSLQEVKKIILNKPENTPIDQIVINSWWDYYDLTELAIKTLEKSKYTQYVKNAKKSFSLCHCDFTYHNLLLNSQEEIYLIDFDFLRCDTRTLDIGKFLRKELPHFNYDFDICELILKGYNEIYPLEKDEYPIIMALILYPNKYLVNVLDLYLNKKERPTKVVLHRLRRILDERNSLNKFIEKFKARYL